MRFTNFALLSALSVSIAIAEQHAVDYEALPLDTLFPGPWENYIRAPVNKSHIVPVKVFSFEGDVSGGESVLENADPSGGISWVIRPGGLITFEFAENIAGR
jgi:hypothetical protein